MATARADGGQDVVKRWGTKQPNGASAGFFDRFEKCVGCGLGHSVGIFHNDHAPAAHGGSPGCAGQELADLIDLDGKTFGADDLDVGMAPGKGAMALLAGATATVWADQGCGEGDGC